jgi:hypothetical protein
MAPLLSLWAKRERVGMAGCLNCELSQLPLVFQTAVEVGEVRVGLLSHMFGKGYGVARSRRAFHGLASIKMEACFPQLGSLSRGQRQCSGCTKRHAWLYK